VQVLVKKSKEQVLVLVPVLVMIPVKHLGEEPGRERPEWNCLKHLYLDLQ
jgi:hypothetical protein